MTQNWPECTSKVVPTKKTNRILTLPFQLNFYLYFLTCIGVATGIISDVSFLPLFLQKDNGGPLVCQEHERKVIIGVSIQRTKCASSQPALFVNVAFYSEWIYKVFKLYPNLERNWWCCVTRPQPAKEDLSSMNHREKRGKSLNGMRPFVDFMPDFVILQRGHSLVSEDGINQIESIQLYKFGLLARMSFLQPKFLAHEQHTNCILTCSEFLKPTKTIRMTQCYLLEYTWIWTKPSSMALQNKQLGFLFLSSFEYVELQTKSIYHQHKWCGGILLVFS